MASSEIVNSPPGDPSSQNDGGNVVALYPRPGDGDFFNAQASVVEDAEGVDLGYTLVHPHDEADALSVGNLARLPFRLANGLGRSAFALARHYSGDLLDGIGSEPEKRVIEVDGQQRLALITESDSDGGSAPISNVLVVGLSELDIGSSVILHKAVARRQPERHTISVMTPGVTMGGGTLSLSEGLSRPLDLTAAENIKVLTRLIDDGPANLVGTSLGSYIAMLMAEQNLAAGDDPLINLSGIKLVSSAVGARNVDAAERFSDMDASDKEFIADMTGRFFGHMPGDIGRMVVRHPERAGECAAALAAYALAPHKLLHRAAAMTGNLRGVQEGIEWDVIKAIASAYAIHVLGGELDPLMQEQLPQWLAIRKSVPETSIRVIRGRGHAMTMHGDETAENLAQMESESVAMAAAA